jgi:uncharacterized membrane protein
VNLNTLLIVGLAGAAAYFLYKKSAGTITTSMGPYTISGPAPNYQPLSCPPGQYSGSDFIGRPMCLPIGAVS